MRLLAGIVAAIVVLAIAGWLGLPLALGALGFHPHCPGPLYQLPGGRALIVTTSHDQLGDEGKKTAFESNTAFRDPFANHVVVDGRLVTGQNQNAGAETAQKMMMVAGGSER